MATTIVAHLADHAPRLDEATDLHTHIILNLPTHTTREIHPDDIEELVQRALFHANTRLLRLNVRLDQHGDVTATREFTTDELFRVSEHLVAAVRSIPVAALLHAIQTGK